MTLYPPGIGTSHGSFLIWLLGTALGIPQMSHTATFKSKAKDHIPKQNRSDLCITSHHPIKGSQDGYERTCTASFIFITVDPEGLKDSDKDKRMELFSLGKCG